VKAFDGVTAKVAAAEDLSATLAVGWEAFQLIAAVADYCAGKASTGFATWMLALAPACEGRDHLSSAPSIPEEPAPRVAQPDLGLVTEDDAASGLARLAQELIRRLQAAASSATVPADSLACKRAAESATEIYRLFASDT
jgi:hypothetical protein